MIMLTGDAGGGFPSFCVSLFLVWYLPQKEGMLSSSGFHLPDRFFKKSAKMTQETKTIK